ncbi:MAG: hypothetical protein Kilf2KO_07620 [Rhodospirillales bacterium]
MTEAVYDEVCLPEPAIAALSGQTQELVRQAVRSREARHDGKAETGLLDSLEEPRLRPSRTGELFDCVMLRQGREDWQSARRLPFGSSQKVPEDVAQFVPARQPAPTEGGKEKAATGDEDQDLPGGTSGRQTVGRLRKGPGHRKEIADAL